MRITHVYVFMKMFWGLKLENGKRYSQLVEKPFHISHAALAVDHSDTGSSLFPQQLIGVHAIVEKTDYIICYLDASRDHIQQPLDLKISEGEEIILYFELVTDCPVTVFLTGYFIEEPVFPQSSEDFDNEYSLSDFSVGEESEDVSSEEDSAGGLTSLLYCETLSSGESDKDYTGHPRRKANSILSLPPTIEEIADETGSSRVCSHHLIFQVGRDSKIESPYLKFKETAVALFAFPPSCFQKNEKGAALGEEGSAQKRSKSSKRKRKREDSDHQLVKDLEPSEHSPTKKRKKRKKKTEVPQSVSSESAQQETSRSKKKTHQASTNVPKKKPVIHKLKGGTEVEEIETGTGCPAKPGKKVFVRYTGHLAHNGKVFESNAVGKGRPFMFRLGQGEVIQGWDEGITGMQVGGKRRLTVPPKQGYGLAGAPPTIPPNSKLIFDVELVDVK